MATSVGFVTIGQSPRDDVVPEVAWLIGRGVRIVEKGALDGLSLPEILRLTPEKGDFPLATRLKDGTPVVVGKKKIIPLLRKQLSLLAGEEVRVVALLCTDEFPRLGAREAFLQPGRLLWRSAVNDLKRGTLGIFVPLASQIRATSSKWRKTGLKVVIEALNPYQESPEQGEALERMRSAGPDLVILNCIGYSGKTARTIEVVMRKPVLFPRALLASEIRKKLMAEDCGKQGDR